MKCFELDEQIKEGLPIDREYDPPEVPQYRGCTEAAVRLDDALSATIKALPPVDDLRLLRADLDALGGFIVLKQELQQVGGQALLYLKTSAGKGGKVRLAADTFDPVMVQGEVRRQYHPFPTAGVEPLALTESALERHVRGVDKLDIYLVLYRGTRFTVLRTGQLDHLPGQLQVHWDGQNLRMQGRNYARFAGAAAEA